MNIPKNLKSFWLNNKNIVYISLPLVVTLSVLSNLGFSKTIGLSAIIATILLVLTIIPINIKPFLPDSKIIKVLSRERRAIGVSAGLLFLFHALSAVNKYISFPISEIPNINFLSGFALNYTMIFLLITSFFGIRAKWKNSWRNMHAIIWFAVPVIIFHVLLNNQVFSGEYISISLIVYALLFIFAVLKFRLSKDKSDYSRDIIFLLLGVLFVVFLIFAFSSQVSAILKIKDNESTSSSVSSASRSSTIKSIQNQTFDDEPTIMSAQYNQSTSAITSGITKEVLAKNNTSGSCYMSYKDNVYDMTYYFKQHPGGSKSFSEACGKDVAFLENVHAGPKPSSKEFQDILTKNPLGKLL